MRRFLLSIATYISLGAPVFGGETADVPIADGFDFPVGKGEGTGYYKARGYTPNGHLGEDWNGVGGGDTDLGDPVYSTANGIVQFAEDYHLGWGNVVIIRHAYFDGEQVSFVDSLYGHLDEIKTEVGAIVKRGQLIGTIGTAHGKYSAHLHFEMRKDIRVGMFRNSFPRDFSVYWDPTRFLLAHRKVPGEERIVAVPIHTFPATPPPLYSAPAVGKKPPVALAPTPSKTTKPGSARVSPFDRFEDLRKLGY